MRYILLLGCAVATVLSATAPIVNGAEQALLQSTIDTVHRMAQAELAKSEVGGCTVGIVIGPKLAWANSYGLADIENNVPTTNENVYRIGSITKQFTGLMLLQLVEDGTVRLSDPVQKYLPEIDLVKDRPEHAQPITLIQLATMTSGLAREPVNLQTYLRGPVSRWEHVLVSALAETRFEFEPGARYKYSNIGYAILGAALGRATNHGYIEHVRRRTLEPLGMNSTAFEPNKLIQKQIVKGYELRQDEPDGDKPEQQHSGRGYKVPNGAMYSTVSDLAKFLAFELGFGSETVLSRQTRESNFERVHSSDGNLSSGYGIGFRLSRSRELVFLGHGGSVTGYKAAAFVHRPSQTGVIVLRNVGGGAFNTMELCHRTLETVATSVIENETNPICD